MQLTLFFPEELGEESMHFPICYSIECAVARWSSLFRQSVFRVRFLVVASTSGQSAWARASHNDDTLSCEVGHARGRLQRDSPSALI